MDKFDFPEILEATFRGVIEIIYFYFITILLFIFSPLKTWDRIYNEVRKPKSKYHFGNIGLSQPTVFFAISLFIFLFFIKLLVITNYLQQGQIIEEWLIFKIAEKVTNIYQFNFAVFIFVLIVANLLFSSVYMLILDELNEMNYRDKIRYLDLFSEKIFGKKIERKHYEKVENSVSEMLTKIFKKLFKVNFEKRQENPISLNFTDINSIYRFITISNFISGFLILVFIPTYIILIKNPRYSCFVYIIFFIVFFPAWFMSNYSIQNGKS